MWPSETVGGGTASARSASPSAGGSCGASRRSVRGASGAGPSRNQRSCSRAEPLEQPGGGLLHAPVLGEPARELLRGLLGLELVELGGLVGEERARLELEQRRDEDEELAARLEVELVPLGHALDEGEDDRRDVDLARLELLLQEQRQQEVERALEGVEVELELPDGRRQHARRLAARPDAPSRHQRSDSASSSASLQREVALEPHVRPVLLPDEHVPREPGASPRPGRRSRRAASRRAARRSGSTPARRRRMHLLDPRSRRRELLQDERLVDREQRRLRDEQPDGVGRPVEEPDRAPRRRGRRVGLLVELEEVESRRAAAPPRARPARRARARDRARWARGDLRKLVDELDRARRRCAGSGRAPTAHRESASAASERREQRATASARRAACEPHAAAVAALEAREHGAARGPGASGTSSSRPRATSARSSSLTAPPPPAAARALGTCATSRCRVARRAPSAVSSSESSRK